jgi:hypothetical protein
MGRTPTAALVANTASASASWLRVTGLVVARVSGIWLISLIVTPARQAAWGQTMCRFGNGGVGVGEQHIVEAVALRDAPSPQ